MKKINYSQLSFIGVDWSSQLTLLVFESLRWLVAYVDKALKVKMDKAEQSVEVQCLLNPANGSLLAYVSFTEIRSKDVHTVERVTLAMAERLSFDKKGKLKGDKSLQSIGDETIEKFRPLVKK